MTMVYMNVRNVDTMELMLGCSVTSVSEVMTWYVYYSVNYPEYTFEIEYDAPQYTCHVPANRTLH